VWLLVQRQLSLVLHCRNSTFPLHQTLLAHHYLRETFTRHHRPSTTMLLGNTHLLETYLFATQPLTEILTTYQHLAIQLPQLQIFHDVIKHRSDQLLRPEWRQMILHPLRRCGSACSIRKTNLCPDLGSFFAGLLCTW
jgi:hypothetical protein